MQASLDELIKVGHAHNRAEETNDLAGTLATLEAEPVYEAYPVALKFEGMAATRAYYEHFFANVAPRIAQFQMRTEWVGKDGVCQEYDVWYQHDDGVTRTHRVLGILLFGRTKLTGERIYSDETFLKVLFGPVWNQMRPIE